VEKDARAEADRPALDSWDDEGGAVDACRGWLEGEGSAGREGAADEARSEGEGVADSKKGRLERASGRMSVLSRVPSSGERVERERERKRRSGDEAETEEAPASKSRTKGLCTNRLLSRRAASRSE